MNKLPGVRERRGLRRSGATDSVEARRLLLLVDDNAAVRATTGLLLHAEGWDVLEAESGEEAVSMYCDAPIPFDLVLMDMRMPGMDGLDAFRALRAVNQAVRVVLVSGSGRNDRVEAGLREGALAFLRKPFAPEELAIVLNRAVGAGTDS